MRNVISTLCSKCIWKEQCGCREPCCHFDPTDEEGYINQQYEQEIKMCKQIADITAAEQGNSISASEYEQE